MFDHNDTHLKLQLSNSSCFCRSAEVSIVYVWWLILTSLLQFPIIHIYLSFLSFNSFFCESRWIEIWFRSEITQKVKNSKSGYFLAKQKKWIFQKHAWISSPAFFFLVIHIQFECLVFHTEVADPATQKDSKGSADRGYFLLEKLVSNYWI